MIISGSGNFFFGYTKIVLYAAAQCLADRGTAVKLIKLSGCLFIGRGSFHSCITYLLPVPFFIVQGSFMALIVLLKPAGGVFQHSL